MWTWEMGVVESLSPELSLFKVTCRISGPTAKDASMFQTYLMFYVHLFGGKSDIIPPVVPN